MLNGMPDDEMKAPAAFYTYLLTCADGTLYCGWTLDPQQRLAAHNAGKGAKYTKTRLPVQLAATWVFESKNEAMRFEYQLKRLPRKQKLALIQGQLSR